VLIINALYFRDDIEPRKMDASEESYESESDYDENEPIERKLSKAEQKKHDEELEV
jgi:hypothetical protein